MSEAKLGGRFTFPGTSLTVRRIGYGAMQLAGPGVCGPPKDPDGRRRRPPRGRRGRREPYRHVRLLRPARHQPDHPAGAAPVPAELVIVTKLGARRPPDGSWQPAISPQDLTAGVHDNLRNLGLDALDIVNYRAMGSVHGPAEGSIAEQVTVLADLQRKGLIRHIGLSNVTAAQVAEAQAITDDRVRAEQLQSGPPPRRRPDRRPGPAGHRRTCRSSRSAGSRRCSRPRCRTSRTGSGPRRCRSRWRGCCTARPTSC